MPYVPGEHVTRREYGRRNSTVRPFCRSTNSPFGMLPRDPPLTPSEFLQPAHDDKHRAASFQHLRRKTRALFFRGCSPPPLLSASQRSRRRLAGHTVKRFRRTSPACAKKRETPLSSTVQLYKTILVAEGCAIIFLVQPHDGIIVPFHCCAPLPPPDSPRARHMAIMMPWSFCRMAGGYDPGRV